MAQTEARRILAGAPVMWRRINSIGVILDCNGAYASGLGYPRSEIVGRPVFEHVPKESWEEMNSSLKSWFETGTVTDRNITFKRRDGGTFAGLLQATSLYDEDGNLLGSNTVIFDLDALTEAGVAGYRRFFEESLRRLAEIREGGYAGLDDHGRAEHDGLEEMFQMLSRVEIGRH